MHYNRSNSQTKSHTFLTKGMIRRTSEWEMPPSWTIFSQDRECEKWWLFQGPRWTVKNILKPVQAILPVGNSICGCVCQLNICIFYQVLICCSHYREYRQIALAWNYSDPLSLLFLTDLSIVLHKLTAMTQSPGGHKVSWTVKQSFPCAILQNMEVLGSKLLFSA